MDDRYIAEVVNQKYFVDIDRKRKMITIEDEKGNIDYLKDNQDTIFYDDFGNEVDDEDVITIVEDNIAEGYLFRNIDK